MSVLWKQCGRSQPYSVAAEQSPIVDDCWELQAQPEGRG